MPDVQDVSTTRSRSPLRGGRQRVRSARAVDKLGATAAAHKAQELRRLNWALAAYARSSAALIRSSSFEEMVRGVCEAIVGEDEYLLATAGLVEDGPDSPIRIVAGAGRAIRYLDGLDLSWSESRAEGLGPAGCAVRLGRPLIVKDVRREAGFAVWRERILSFGIRSSVAVPFKRDEQVVGILKVYAARPDAFGPQELDVFARLGRELAFALGVEESRGRLRAAEEARRAAEERAQESLAELARVARVLSVGAFAASLAHEVNQPVAAIMANGEAALRWLAKSPPNLDEARAALQRITRDAGRTSAVVGGTRAMLAKDIGQRGALEVAALLQETVLFTRPQQKQAQVKVEIAVADGLPAVWADRVQIQQVLVNLIVNAIDAMKPVTGRKRILRIGAEVYGSDQVLVSVADSGVGVEPEDAERVFTHLFTTKADGVGLGLPICKTIVEAHGGRIEMTPGRPFGATFSFTLPTAEAA